jgi:hypothetical protein
MGHAGQVLNPSLQRRNPNGRIQRLEALGEQLDGGNPALRRIRGDDMPIIGTRLIREYQGVEHSVTVLQCLWMWRILVKHRRVLVLPFDFRRLRINSKPVSREGRRQATVR